MSKEERQYFLLFFSDSKASEKFAFGSPPLTALRIHISIDNPYFVE
jgi:hypothetical protein